MNNPFRAILAATTLFWLALPATSSAQTGDQPVRVMSFNIRLGVANDGDNHWEKRKDLVIKTIDAFQPDVLGTQETWDFQARYLEKQLAGYTYVGRSRQVDGKGEQCGILFRTSRFDKLIEGHFWLSTSPDEPGSKSWDSSLPRMVTWLKLWDRLNKRSMYVLNTHFDHRGKIARQESAKLIRNFVESMPADSNIVVTGDFNAAEESQPYQVLFGDLKARPSILVDTFRSKHEQAGEREGTFNGFKGKDSGGRIDWIACSTNWEIVSAEIDKTSFENRYPSDHFPVNTVLRFNQNVDR